MIKKIISGGQTGADYGGLLAGRTLGLETGGTAPKGWRVRWRDGTEGSNPVLESFGLVEHDSDDYPPRTKQNVNDACGTVWFGHPKSLGGRLTISTAKRSGRPCIVNPSVEELQDWLIAQKIEILNVAGNSAASNPRIEAIAFNTLVSAIDPIIRGRK